MSGSPQLRKMAEPARRPAADREVRRTLERVAALLFAVARLVFCIYRASHQSVVHDEAFTYARFVSGPWSTVYSPYDANNHVLHSILAKLSIKILGLSELTLRLPSLLAGFVLMLGVYRLLELATPTLIRWVAYIAIGLHPLLLDFSVAARGYSLSIALLVWAMCLAWEERYWWSGALLGLAVAANLNAAFPALALMGAVVLARRRWTPLAGLALPAVALFTLICYPALSSAARSEFYAGQPTIAKAVFSLVVTSLHTKLEGTGLFGKDHQATIVANAFLPVVGALILWAGFRMRDSIPILTLAITTAGLIAAHVLFGLNYPEDRTGLYFVPIFGVAWAVAATNSAKWLRAVHLALACALVIQFATQLQTRYFLIWYYDMQSRNIASRLKESTARSSPASISVSVTDLYQPALEFYREYLAIVPLQPIRRQAPTEFAGYDYYVLSVTDAGTAAATRLPVLYRDPLSQVTLARNP
jgi:hypothetical protein